MAEKDITEKILLSYEDVFPDIMNALLFKGGSRSYRWRIWWIRLRGPLIKRMGKSGKWSGMTAMAKEGYQDRLYRI